MSELAEQLARMLVPRNGHLTYEQLLAAHSHVNPARLAVIIQYLDTNHAFEELPDDAPHALQRWAHLLHMHGITYPRPSRCPTCQYRRELAHRLPDGRLVCRRCASRASRTPCGQCGRTRQTYRTIAGKPLCRNCANPSTLKTCVRCGFVGSATRRIDGNDVCLGCEPPAHRLCTFCGRIDRIAADILGGSMCWRCYRAMLRNPKPCPGCGDARILAHLSPSSTPVCATCAGVPSRFACTRCHSEHFYVGRLCARCVTADVLDDMMGPAPQDSALETLRQQLLAKDNPYNTHKWLTRSNHRATLRAILSGELPRTHQSLEGLKPGAALTYLRRLLIHTGVLPEIDIELRRAETGIEKFLATCEPRDRLVLERYAKWVVLKNLRRSARSATVSMSASGHAQMRLRKPAKFLIWLHKHEIELADLSQIHWDAYTSVDRDQRWAPSFIRWLNTHHGTSIKVASPVRLSPALQVSESDRMEAVRVILRHESMTVDVRAMCLLVIVYGVKVTTVVAMKPEQIVIRQEKAYVKFTDKELETPAFLADLLRSQLASANTEWLFPGKNPGDHHSTQFAILRKTSIRLADMQVAARYHLGATMAPALISTTFGLGLGASLQYSHLSGGSWGDVPALND